ncbi:MAG: triose-phosphate isomerase [Patescibacteria group bacterium]
MKKLIIANWKMHYGPIKAGGWIRAFRRERLPKDLDISVAVPFVSLAAARASLGRASIPALGAQDCFWSEEGPFTGEISPDMLKEFGTEYCLVGHSERRTYLGETDEMVAKKAAALQKAGIVPVICVGETDAQRKKGETNKTVRAQVQAAIAGLKGDGKAPAVLAYEPIWAIGSGRPCSAQDAKEVHQAIRGALEKKFGKLAEETRILYGGSVDPRNVAEYMTTTGVDGVLVGGASLDPRTFGLLCRSAVPA